MSKTAKKQDGLSVDEGVRTMLLLLPRVVGRIKKVTVPAELQSAQLAPRHLTLLALLLLDGEATISELAARLEIAPATVSLMVGELSRKGILERHEDDTDRRRTIVSISEQSRPAVDRWLSRGANAWRTALSPLTAAERQLVIDTMRTYEEESAKS